MARPNRPEFVEALQRAFLLFLRIVADVTLPTQVRLDGLHEANRIQALLERDGKQPFPE